MNQIKKYGLIILVLILGNHIKINAQKLSDKAQISLLTCNPGNDLYATFGHSAIRVKDPKKKIDWVYNYGTMDFSDPNFYIKFVRGYLNYQLSVNTMKQFMYEYRYYNRSVYEQVLDFNAEQKERIFEFLEFNRLPENKFYLYDFLFDNCATRIRDVFQDKIGGDSIVFYEDKYEKKTFRQIMKPYLAPKPWARYGINMILGSIADRDASVLESMFLPDAMKLAFSNASINNKPLVVSSRVLFEQKVVDDSSFFLFRPGSVFWILFFLLVIVTFLENKKGRNYRIVDSTFFFLVGVAGMICFLMWFATSHTATVKNWNILWAIPLHLFIAFMVFRKSKSKFLFYYFVVTCSLSVLTLMLFLVLPQEFDYASIPLILALSLRSFKLFRYYK